MSTRPRTVKSVWIQLFVGFILLQLIVVVLGVMLANSSGNLGLEEAKKLDAMRQAFQSISAVGVIACLVVTRAKLHPSAIHSPQDLFRATALCLAVGELTILVALVGLAKLHVAQFLVTCALVFLADFALILPAGLKILRSPTSDGNN